MQGQVMVPALQLLQTKKLNGCWECPAFPCDNPMFNKQRVRAFAAFVLEHGEAALSGLCKRTKRTACSTIIRGGSSETMICPKTGSAIRASC